MEWSLRGATDFKINILIFPTKLNVEIESPKILYVVIFLVHSFLKTVSWIIPKKDFVGAAQGLKTTQRSNSLCLATI